MTIWHTPIACWITKATNTHSQYVILIHFPLQQWLHETASMFRYTNIACLVKRNVIQYAKWRGSNFVRRQSLFCVKHVGEHHNMAWYVLFHMLYWKISGMRGRSIAGVETRVMARTIPWVKFTGLLLMYPYQRIINAAADKVVLVLQQRIQ
jgi:hypothetical protein